MSLNERFITSKYIIFVKKFSSNNKSILKNLLTYQDFEVESMSIDLLKDCLEPKSAQFIIDKYGNTIFDEYIKNKLIIGEEAIWNQLSIEQIEIEINSDCNFGCRFCPVSIEPRSSKFMSMELFDYILEKIEKLPEAQFVSFSSYNEPLLDPFFLERCKKISGTNLRLKLNTNGSLLNETIAENLLKLDIIEFINFNLPSVEQAENIRLTNTDEDIFNKVLVNIESTIKLGLPVKISVNGTPKEIDSNLAKIRERYSRHLDERFIQPVRTLDRAGCLKNEYNQNISVNGKLTGWCFRPLKWAVISVIGDLYLCTNNFKQDYIYGNIKDGDIQDLLNSEQAQMIRKKIYGETESEPNFICRNCEYMARGNIFQRYNPLRARGMS